MNALAVRINRENPDHHLWNNNGTWWCHFTVHHPDYTKTRVRRSLNTIDVLTARSRRDQLLQNIDEPRQMSLPSTLNRANYFNGDLNGSVSRGNAATQNTSPKGRRRIQGADECIQTAC